MLLTRKKRPTSVPSQPTEYPADTVVKTPKGIYLIRRGRAGYYRLRIPTQRVLDSWAFPRIAITSDEAVSKTPVTGKLGFRNGSLLYNLADGKLYLVAEQKLRHITSPDVLDRLGATSKDFLTVSATEISLHQEAEPLE